MRRRVIGGTAQDTVIEMTVRPWHTWRAYCFVLMIKGVRACGPHRLDCHDMVHRATAVATQVHRIVLVLLTPPLLAPV
eukprot:6285723-Pyramimonas_sp.AAC.1